jgi:protein-disulfide isomerase
MKYASFAFAIVSLILTGSGAALAGDGFSDAQKDEIGKIVREYLLKNPEIVSKALETLQQHHEEQQLALARQGIKENAKALFHSPLDYVIGPADAKVTVVEFFDYNCPYCKRSQSDVDALEKGGQVRIVLKEFPILGEGSEFASRAAVASKSQGKYMEFHRAMLAASGHIAEPEIMSIAAKVGLDTEKLRKDMHSPEIDEPIKLSHDLANKLGINGTPTFIIGDRMSPGAVGLEALQNDIAAVRDKGCDFC